MRAGTWADKYKLSVGAGAGKYKSRLGLSNKIFSREVKPSLETRDRSGVRETQMPKYLWYLLTDYEYSGERCFVKLA